MGYHMYMSSSLSDILGNRQFNEPPEIEIIKQFVKSRFNHMPSVKLTENSIIITVPGSALAGALRPQLHELENLLHNNGRRLSIRIGSK